jgi:hypothetical protein
MERAHARIAGWCTAAVGAASVASGDAAHALAGPGLLVQQVVKVDGYLETAKNVEILERSLAAGNS